MAAATSLERSASGIEPFLGRGTMSGPPSTGQNKPLPKCSEGNKKARKEKKDKTATKRLSKSGSNCSKIDSV